MSVDLRMNLYKFHAKPQALYRYKDALNIPKLRWEMLVTDVEKEGLEVDVDGKLKRLTHLWIRDPYTAVEYAVYADLNRWPEAEPIISTDANASLVYSRYILEKPWPPGEAAMFSDPEVAIRYVHSFREMWPIEIPEEYLRKILPEIVKSSSLSLMYALHIVKGRFPEGEEAMRKGTYYWAQYGQFMYKQGYEEEVRNGKRDFYPRADF